MLAALLLGITQRNIRPRIASPAFLLHFLGARGSPGCFTAVILSKAMGQLATISSPCISEHFALIRIELIGPKMGAGPGVDKLSGDTNAPAALLRASLESVATPSSLPIASHVLAVPVSETQFATRQVLGAWRERLVVILGEHVRRDMSWLASPERLAKGKTTMERCAVAPASRPACRADTSRLRRQEAERVRWRRRSGIVLQRCLERSSSKMNRGDSQ